MSKFYYLFSETDAYKIHGHKFGGFEAVYICNGWSNNFKSPILQTEVYPVGTILSKAINVMKPWSESNFEPYLRDKKLSEGFEKILEQESSFSNVVYDDSAVRVFLESILNRNSGNFLLMDNKHASELLQNYMNFIELNQKAKEHSSIINLRAFASKNNNELPKRSIEPDFIPTIRKLESISLSDTSTTRTKATSWELNPPISIFQIHDIMDFILASLQCIFEQNYVIGKCNYYDCGDLFVTHNRSLRYCPVQNSDNKIKTCQERANPERQKERMKGSESQKIKNRIRNKLYMRIDTIRFEEERNVRRQEYEDFKTQTKKIWIEVKEGKQTEEYFINWMKQYWENVRLNSKIRKKQYNSKL